MLKVKARSRPVDYVIALMRISLGWIFLWAFADKLWGLGFATCRNPETGVVNVMCDSAWAAGGSPTTGFLQHATKGPFAEFFNNMAGNMIVDWAFMIGLLLIGISLVLGVAVYLGVFGGSLMLLAMWLAVLPPENNPFMVDHLVYILALLVVALTNDRQQIGLGRWWSRRPMVKKYGWLK